MNRISIHPVSRRPDLSHLAQVVRRHFEAARERRRVRREMAELSRLPLHLLQDMGLEKHAAPRTPDYGSHHFFKIHGKDR